jgi:PTH1 family peptidyl-tRNA hydrolase
LKFLVAGLGNIGEEYYNTRHNIGFRILDSFAKTSNIKFMDKRYGFVAEYSYAGKQFVLLKPTTYVNRSGRAVNYWLNKAKVHVENLLVIVDDLALPLGTLKIKSKGGDGGHNGLQSINQILGHQNYARLKFGIGSDYSYGSQVNYVLGEWSDEEEKVLKDRIPLSHDIIISFGINGIEKTMNDFNNKLP